MSKINWQNFWNQQANNNNTLLQVGRVSNSEPHEETILDKTALYIKEQLQLQHSHDVLDICCGNGALTHKVANYCNSVTGVDFSDELLTIARNKFADIDVKYIAGNALNFELNTKFNAAYLYFSFQYFTSLEEAEKVLENALFHLNMGGKLLIGDIPDASRKFKFYNTFSSRLKFFFNQINGQNCMGKFWSRNELDNLCKKLKVRGEFLVQPEWQPYHTYRFNYLIEKV